MGTGEGNPRNSQSQGAGVYKSIDGGRSWEYMGLEETRNIHRLIIHPDNPDVVYVGAQGNAWADTEERGVYKTTDGGQTWEKILYNNQRTGIGDLVMDPSNENRVFSLYTYMSKSEDGGKSFESLYPYYNWVHPDHHAFWLSETERGYIIDGNDGGLTMDATGAENFTTILAIEPSPLEEGVIWAGTDDGKVHITRNGGESWTDLTANLEDVPEGSWVAQVKASPHDAAEAVAVINNYRRGDWGTYVLRTTDYGESWENIAEEKGLEGYALSYVQDPEQEKLQFIGTELGLYVSIDGGEKWTKWTSGYPTVSTYDMVIHPREHDLVIGTFGRSFWVLDDIRPLRELARGGTDGLERVVKVFPSPDAYLADWREAAGTRFSADGMYAGENRPQGARLTYAINSEELPDSVFGEEDERQGITSNPNITVMNRL